MKAKTIRLKGCQSHKDTKLELSSGLNIITGDSGSGKSAFMRGIELIIENDLKGYGYKPVTFEADHTSGQIDFDDNVLVERFRNNEFNGYKSKVNGKSLIDFPKSGDSVPEPIQQLLKLGEINFQGQEDERFLISRKISPGEVARKLNTAVGLSIIHTSQAKVKKLISDQEGEIKRQEKDLKERLEQLEELSYLDNLEQKMIQLESYLEKKKQINTKAKYLTELLTHIDLLEAEIDERNVYLDQIIPKLNRIQNLITERIKIIEKRVWLKNILNKVEKLKETIDIYNDWLIVEEPFKKIMADLKIRNEIIENSYKLRMILGNIKQYSDLIQTCQDRIDFLEKRKAQYKVCPLCGTRMEKIK